VDLIRVTREDEEMRRTGIIQSPSDRSSSWPMNTSASTKRTAQHEARAPPILHARQVAVHKPGRRTGNLL
jgi:hypothetical protein